jgi:predicted ferric reductase
VSERALPAAWRRSGPPLLALGLAAGAVWWAFPAALAVWRAAGIVTAWAGTALLVASLILMVREPGVARRLGGLEAMYAWHHRSGVLAYVLLLAHPLALALDAWREQPARAWPTLAPWLQGWPVWLGWVALLLLMSGLATSFARRIAYRRWRALHYLLGLGVLLGLAHVLVLLGDTALPLVGGAIAALALGWRLAVTDRGLSALAYRVARVAHPAQDVVEATLQPLAAAMAPAPGQFVLARFADGAQFRACGEFHPFTVSGIGSDGTLRVTIKALGACSAQVQAITSGVMVWLQGPFGDFLAPATAAPRLWVAGGIGITPFMAALRSQPCRQPTTLVYLYRTAADAAFLDELERLQATDPLFRLLAQATGPGLPDLEALLAQVDRLAERQVHVCGPAPLLADLRPRLHAHGVAPGAIRSESFDFR